jgi:hypothetical protein
MQLGRTLKRTRILFVTAILAIAWLIIPVYPAFAQTPPPAPTPAPSGGGGLTDPDEYDISNNIIFLGGDECDLGAASAEGDTPLPAGADNIERAFKWLHGKLLGKNSEYPAEQAAGIVGNLILESQLNPKAVNPIGAYGIAQWLGVRKTLLQKRANYDTLEVQLNYLWWEITQGSEKGALTDLLKMRSPSAAAISWEQHFERSGGAGMAQRISNAVKVFNEYGSSVGNAGGAPVGSPCNPADAGGPGSVNPDGYAFPVAPQRKSQNSGVPAMSSLPCPNLGSPYCHRGTPAFDIGRKPGGDGVAGTSVYAINDGTIYNAHTYNGIRGCYSFHIKAKDTYDYYYTHVMNIKSSGTVKSGAQVATIGLRRCTGNGSVPHLHIDRGCVQNGVPQPGGYGDCRDPKFVPLMNNIFNAMPN